MTSPVELFRKAQSFGLRVSADGDALVVSPKSKCTPELVAELREHKQELLAWLSRPTATVPPDELPTNDEILHRWPAITAPRHPVKRGGTAEQWLTVARQIINGEFVGADSSTIESLSVGLRSLLHPAVHVALRKLAGESACPASVRKSILSLLTP